LRLPSGGWWRPPPQRSWAACPPGLGRRSTCAAPRHSWRSFRCTSASPGRTPRPTPPPRRSAPCSPRTPPPPAGALPGPCPARPADPSARPPPPPQDWDRVEARARRLRESHQGDEPELSPRVRALDVGAAERFIAHEVPALRGKTGARGRGAAPGGAKRKTAESAASEFLQGLSASVGQGSGLPDGAQGAAAGGRRPGKRRRA